MKKTLSIFAIMLMLCGVCYPIDCFASDPALSDVSVMGEDDIKDDEEIVSDKDYTPNETKKIDSETETKRQATPSKPSGSTSMNGSTSTKSSSKSSSKSSKSSSSKKTTTSKSNSIKTADTSSSSSSTTPSNPSPSVGEASTAPQTRDNTMVPYFMVMACAFGLTEVFVLKKRRYNE